MAKPSTEICISLSRDSKGKQQWVAYYDDDDDHRHGHGPDPMIALADLVVPDLMVEEAEKANG